MSKENIYSIQKLKENLQIICNKIETILLDLKEMKEKNNELKTQQSYFTDSNSKINLINKLKHKINYLQNNLENIYNINNINRIESEIKKKNLSLHKLSEEQTLLFNLIKGQKKEIEFYSSKFTENKEINDLRQKLNFAKEENRLKKESFTILNAKVKGQMAKIDLLEKQMNIIKQNIEYQKNKQKKEVEKSLNFEEDENDENNTDNLNHLLETEKMLISEISKEEKNFQNEIFQQNILIHNIKEEINKFYEEKKQIREKEEKMKKIRIIKYKSNEKVKNTKHNKIQSHTKGQSLDYKVKIPNLNKISYKYNESPKNATELNNIHFKLNNKPFNAIKFNDIYKNIFGQKPNNKNNIKENIYSSFYERNINKNKKEPEGLNIKTQHKNAISNDIEKLRNEIKYALKNNVVFLNSPTNIKVNNNINNENINTEAINCEINHKINNKPFNKFIFS